MADIGAEPGDALMDDYFDASRWILAFQLLSLDFVRPVYRHLGVGVQFEETVRGLARDALIGRYEPANSPLQANSQEQEVAAYKANIAPGLGALAAGFGEDQTERLRYWVRYVWDTVDNPWMPYETFMSDWAQKVRRGDGDQVRLASDALAIANEYRSATSTRDIKEKLVSSYAKSLSDWDRRLFELRECTPDSEFCPFRDEIYLAVRMNRFQRYFVRISNMVDRLALQEAVKRAADVTAATAFRELAEESEPHVAKVMEFLANLATRLPTRKERKIVAIDELPQPFPEESAVTF